MSHKLQALTIDNFRGIQHLEIIINGHNLIITGENGAGKSSIVDALEYCFTGTVAKLQGRADVNPISSIPYFGRVPTKIQLCCTGHESEPIVVTHPQNGGTVPKRLGSFYGLAANRRFILRRSQLLQFVDARPSERYEQISQLIGLSALDDADKAWRTANVKASNEQNTLQQDCDDEFSKLSGLLNTRILTIPQLVTAINAQLSRFNLPLLSRREQLDQRRESLLKSLTVTPDSVNKIERLSSLRATIQEVTSLIGELGKGEKERQLILAEFLSQSEFLTEASLEELLVEARKFVEAQERVAQCPVCESPIADTTRLLSRLSDRLTSLQSLTSARRLVSEATYQIATQLAIVQQRVRALFGKLAGTEFEPRQEFATALSRDLVSWQERLQAGLQGKLPLERLRQLYQQAASLATEIDEALRSQSLAPDQAARLNFIDTLSRLDVHWQALLKLMPRLRQASLIHDQLELVYSELLEARKRGLLRLGNELKDDLQHMYDRLHPGEGYRSIALPVQMDRRSSVGLDAQFHDQEKGHPLNYFSEGHLDSLGLCIFLAFIKRINGDLKLLVLDDVLTTVDAGHRLRVARLLAQEFADYQIIITTHDQFWARQLEQSLPRSQLLRLAQWSPDLGADSLQLIKDWDYYLQQARQGRTLDAVAGAGRNLEKFLLHMRYNLQLAVPARTDEAYTIGDLYGPLFSWLTHHQPQRLDRPDFEMEMRTLKREFEEVWRFRNWAGAHFNDWAANLSVSEAVAFIETMAELEAAFSCPACGHLVAYRSSSQAVVCPQCPAVPPAVVNWVYRPDWRQKAESVLRKDKPEIRQHAIGLAQSSWRNFLQDMRRRLQLVVPAALNGQYDIQDLHQPFFDWMAQHPLPSSSDWARCVAEAQQQLASFWQNDSWRKTDLAEAGYLINAIANVTHRFHCSQCQNLLAYNNPERQYYCLSCTATNEKTTAGAFWFVRKPSN
jgi:Zn finger protein HypA/HybF involved in hydrogenase expression